MLKKTVLVACFMGLSGAAMIGQAASPGARLSNASIATTFKMMAPHTEQLQGPINKGANGPKSLNGNEAVNDVTPLEDLEKVSRQATGAATSGADSSVISKITITSGTAPWGPVEIASSSAVGAGSSLAGASGDVSP